MDFPENEMRHIPEEHTQLEVASNFIQRPENLTYSVYSLLQ
jgi:hypothetical protein